MTAYFEYALASQTSVIFTRNVLHFTFAIYYNGLFSFVTDANAKGEEIITV